MTDALMLAAGALADALDAENAALRALDVPRAVAGFARKVECAQHLQRALSEPVDPATAAVHRAACRACAERLRQLADDNRRLLERAMFVQARLIATLARAVPTPRVGYGGTIGAALRREVCAPAMTLSARI